MSIKLTDSQLVMLSEAARRKDRCLVAPPPLKGRAGEKVGNRLISSGLVKEIKAKAGTPVWRRDAETGQAYALKLTGDGAKAVAIDESPAPEPAGGEPADGEGGSAKCVDQKAGLSSASVEIPPTELAPVSPSAPRSGSKLARVIELLRRDYGATLDELIAATGWLAHTTRAALTGLRKRGYGVALDRSDNERGSFYRIKPDPGPPAARLVEGSANSGAARKPPRRRWKPGARRAA